MNSVTLDQVLAWQPCYDHEKVEILFAGRATLTATDILDLPIQAEDRLWAVLREEVLPDPILHEFACRCAEQALEFVGNPDPRSVAAIDAKRAWLRGEISDQELAAARDAAMDAARAAARAAAKASARAAARDAARTSAWTAARDAAKDAAEDAAEDAAWDAAMAAALTSVRDAAEDAAEDAARAAAMAAAWAAQIEILRLLLN